MQQCLEVTSDDRAEDWTMARAKADCMDQLIDVVQAQPQPLQSKLLSIIP